MIGLDKNSVVLVKHFEEWSKLYEQEKEILENLLIGQYISIQHVGSTSIPGLLAKPIIDIAIGVDSIEKMNLVKAILIDNGYNYCSNRGSDDRIFLAKGCEENRTHYLHVEIFGGISWNNHIAFKEYLTCHHECIFEYEAIKVELANKYPNNRDKYTLGKNQFIQSILKKYREQAENVNNI